MLPFPENTSCEGFSLLRVPSFLLTGLASRVIGFTSLGRGIAQADAVRAYYRRARGNEPSYDVLDLNSVPYQRFLQSAEAAIPPLQGGAANVIDLGCGHFSFLRYLVAKDCPPAAYHGVDLYINGVERLTFKA
jgi:hypothetical protein